MSCVVPEWVTDCHCNKLSVCGKAKQGLQHFVLGSRAGVVHLGGAQRWKGRENWPEEVVNSLLWESVWFMCLTHKHCTVLKYTQAVHSHLFCAWTHTHTHSCFFCLVLSPAGGWRHGIYWAEKLHSSRSASCQYSRLSWAHLQGCRLWTRTTHRGQRIHSERG